ncbi:MAG TPA: SpoIIE family protein phosphatase [Candidatus Acidoferrum sp.]|nr:SpoIIE family protein phosphatase [Candidatus Acidoferrum sp.]
MTRAGRLSSIFGFLSAAAVFIAFLLAAFGVRAAIDRNAESERNLRFAHVDRARMLRLQLDEETAVRGYAATHLRLFLDPYRAAVRALPVQAALLSRRLVDLSVDPSPVQQEVILNGQWLRGVASPLIRDPASGSRVKIELLGKQLVDRYREADASLMAEIDAAAERSEAATARAVNETFAIAILGGAAIAALLAWFSMTQRRLATDAELHRLAYIEEKRIADALQEAFLQKKLPYVADADLHAVYVPAGRESRVGGDWYDAFELGDGRILFSIGDVAGHGIEAAVIMSRVRQAILSVGVEESDPANVLARTNEILLMQDATMVTAICGVIDLAQGVVRIANAGHPPAIMLFDGNRVEQIGASGPPLGAIDRASYTVTSVLATPGSLLTLYTDGLIENDHDCEDGERRVLEALRAIPRDGGDAAAALLERIFGGETPADDVAILTIAFREDAGERGAEGAGAAKRARPILRHDVRLLLAS